MNHDTTLPSDEDNHIPNLTLRDAALSYAQRGWPVLSLHTVVADKCACGNATCDSPGKHPRTAHGVKDATTNEVTIQQWWTQWPEANIGLATGAVSGIVALDVDPRHGGYQSLGQLLQAHASPLPDTPLNLTGSGGAHLLFAHPGQPISNKVGLMPGLDI